MIIDIRQLKATEAARYEILFKGGKVANALYADDEAGEVYQLHLDGSGRPVRDPDSPWGWRVRRFTGEVTIVYRAPVIPKAAIPPAETLTQWEQELQRTAEREAALFPEKVAHQAETQLDSSAPPG